MRPQGQPGGLLLNWWETLRSSACLARPELGICISSLVWRRPWTHCVGVLSLLFVSNWRSWSLNFVRPRIVPTSQILLPVYSLQNSLLPQVEVMCIRCSDELSPRNGDQCTLMKILTREVPLSLWRDRITRREEYWFSKPDKVLSVFRQPDLTSQGHTSRRWGESVRP